jgi:mannose-6-phosphate isomerase-like protein (cupin superfamily)
LRAALIAAGILVVTGGIVLVGQVPGGPTTDPKAPVFWSASQLKEIDARLAPRVSSETNMAGQSLLASASVIYRTGPSQSEIHEKEADFIFVREGEGSIVVGGKILGGKPARSNEIRGDSIDGGTRYPVSTGDTLYVPANTPHQFFVEKGKHWVIMIVKITPKV